MGQCFTPPRNAGTLLVMKALNLVALAAVVLALADSAAAQFGFRGGFGMRSVPLAKAEDFDGRFHYCRAVYDPNPRGDSAGWLTDYPSADVNLSIRASELTKMSVAFGESGYRAVSSASRLLLELGCDQVFSHHTSAWSGGTRIR